MLKPEDKFLIVTSYDENDPTIARVKLNDIRQQEYDKKGYIEFTSFNASDSAGVPYKKVSEVPKDTKVKEVVKEPQEILKLTRARKMPEVVPVKSKPSVEKGFEGGIIKGKTDTAFDKSMSNRGYEISDINSSKGKIGNKYVKTLPNGQKIEVLYTYKTQNGIDDGEIILKIREKNGEVDGGKSYIDKGAFANDLISFEKIPETVPVKTKELRTKSKRNI